MLTTTRTVRRRLDLERPVAPGVLARCVEIALQAPSGSDRQTWHFVVVTDADRRAGLAAIYRAALAERRRLRPAHPAAGGPHARMTASVDHLAANLERVPALVVPCIDGRYETEPLPVQAAAWGSILPAVWSFMLACRTFGLGTAWTTLHLDREREVADLLGIPADSVTQAALIPVAHVVGGPLRPAPRRPVDDVLHWDAWPQR